ncbi:MAG: hypothetical protein WAW23_08120 [Candidatus Methanoperedens sp.]
MSLQGINNILRSFLDLVENDEIPDAESMIEGMNIQFNQCIDLPNEQINDKETFKQLAMRFWTLEDRLSSDTKTQNLRFNVNNIERNIE